MEYPSSNFTHTDIKEFKIKMLNWASRFNIFSFLDNNGYTHTGSRFDAMMAVSDATSFSTESDDVFSELKAFSGDRKWLFGHINYPSSEKDPMGFPSASFFTPEVLISIRDHNIQISASKKNPEDIFRDILQTTALSSGITNVSEIKHRISAIEYIESVKQLLRHIQRGDCYEINFCQEFYANNVSLDPLQLFHELNTYSPNPFAALYKLEDKYCVCASPERFIRREGNVLISQPIKGTSKRYTDNQKADEDSRNHLINSEKERSENVMIVDLVRNDLSRICTEGSVKVKELFGIYSFPQVHQMISTIQGEVESQAHWADILSVCYPMGSMTGAPKKRVMELISKYEASPRGLFSGTIGYVTPEGDFDFNVVIRSLFYNSTTKTISFKSGGGITANSNPELEYQESLVKAGAIKKILQTGRI